MRQKLLVSACLLGAKVRYDGGDCRQSGLLQQWLAEGRVVPFCPEVEGGLLVPRPAAEIQPDGRVLTVAGEDVSTAFTAGAERALALCRKHRIGIAILKEGSPSCGSHRIHNGRFEQRQVAGEGVTTSLLRSHGIQVFSEQELAKVESLLD